MFILITVVIAVVFIGFIFFFTSSDLSPVPYFPTNKNDLPLTIKSFQLENFQTVFDLGAGDGIILLEAAKNAYKERLNTKFIGVEINPVLVLILQVRALFHPNRKNIRIMWGDMFKLNYCKLLPNTYTQAVFYLYVSPWYLEKALREIMKVTNPKRIVTYMYYIKSLAHKEKSEQGLHKVYIYDLTNLDENANHPVA